mmetsp:Transcript_4279/g.9305  ORF Transcript_4279/g.9305 Transcript_4279/m.9305 type:complete len:219 (-) Transcript_4279:1119-1775(-)
MGSAEAGAGAPPATPGGPSGTVGTRTTDRKSISDSFCIMSTKSWRAIRLMAGSTPCISGEDCDMNCCHVPTIFCKEKYMGRRVTGSSVADSPSADCFCILIWAMVKTGISLKVSLNLGDSVMAFSTAFCAISGVIVSPFLSISPSSGFIVNNIRAPRRSLVSGTRRYWTPLAVSVLASSSPGFLSYSIRKSTSFFIVRNPFLSLQSSESNVADQQRHE